MNSAVGLDRLQFAFRVTFHYIFPQLTMELALLIVGLKVPVLAKRNELYSDLARFWMRIFAVKFAMESRNRHPYGIPIQRELGRVFGTAGGVCQFC
jgi:cytochrome d ubiquinol oxidase subunit I